MWIGNIKVKEKITETLIFFCQVLMIFFFTVLLNEYDNYTNAQDFNAFILFFLIATMMEKRSNLMILH